jgi:hypothetical protein
MAGDDAEKAVVYTRDNLPKLAFDHLDILEDYFKGQEDSS